jgi:hypothetical protein
MNWFEACMTVKLNKKDMNRETLEGIASAFLAVHFYTNYTTNTVVLVGDSKEVSNAIDILRYKAQSKRRDIRTSAYSEIKLLEAKT